VFRIPESTIIDGRIGPIRHWQRDGLAVFDGLDPSLELSVCLADGLAYRLDEPAAFGQEPCSSLAIRLRRACSSKAGAGCGSVLAALAASIRAPTIP
jgi:hypothetical protein